MALGLLHVVGEKVSHELTFSACCIEQDYHAMVTLVEFQYLGLMNCSALSRVGGHVSFVIQNKVKITQDPWVLSVVRDRYQAEWLKKPFQVVDPLQTFFNKEKSLLIDQEVQDMVLKGAIEQVSDCPGRKLICS